MYTLQKQDAALLILGFPSCCPAPVGLVSDTPTPASPPALSNLGLAMGADCDREVPGLVWQESVDKGENLPGRERYPCRAPE